jgi:thiol-disulfide isomerase/thioredoxin
MKNGKFKWNNILFVVFCALLLIPQTRGFIKLGVNKIKVAVWAPSVEAAANQLQLSPFDYAANDLSGKNNTIAIGKGKVTFLSYWATWCPPCLAELPGIQKLYQDYDDRIQFVLLTNEEPEKVRQFLTKKEYDLPVYFSQMEAPVALKSRSIPTNYVIDAQGKIIIKESGAANWNSERVRQLFDNLLQE